MTEGDEKKPDEKPTPPEGTLKATKITDRGMELVVRLRNPGNRALHYISDVRALRYEPANKRLIVRLSDEGRTVIPGAMFMLPSFRVIDPNSNVEIKIDLPETIVKLAESATPSGEVAFEEQKIIDAQVIEVDIAWADTPFYMDPRESDDGRLPTARWQQDELRVSGKPPSNRKR
jgi:hypothetical protein